MLPSPYNFAPRAQNFEAGNLDRQGQEILDAFDQSIATVREVLPGFDDAAMNANWRIVAGDREIAAMPRVAFLRNIMLNHWYQHRGQFCVYLRLLDVPVPSSWGPSADEQPRMQDA